MDGFTVTMTLKMDVIPNEENDITIGIVDVGDSSYDSNVLIAGGSVQTSVVAVADETTMGLIRPRRSMFLPMTKPAAR